MRAPHWLGPILSCVVAASACAPLDASPDDDALEIQGTTQAVTTIYGNNTLHLPLANAQIVGTTHFKGTLNHGKEITKATFYIYHADTGTYFLRKQFDHPPAHGELNYAYDTTALDPGQYRVFFDAYDIDGNRLRTPAPDRLVTVSVPKTRAIHPTGHGKVFQKAPTIFSARLKENVSGIRTVQFRIKKADGSGDTAVCTQSGTDLRGNFTCGVDLTSYAPGNYAFNFIGLDGAGVRREAFEHDVPFRVVPPWTKPKAMYDHDYSSFFNIPSYWDGEGAPPMKMDKDNRHNWPAHKLFSGTGSPCVRQGANAPCMVFQDEVYQRLLKRSIQEVAAASTEHGGGIDTIVFSSGTGEVPLWKSEYYPFAAHEWLWMNKNQLLQPNGDPVDYARANLKRALQIQYLYSGGDAIADAVDAAHNPEEGVQRTKLYVSLRMNDKHFTHVSDVFNADGSVKPDHARSQVLFLGLSWYQYEHNNLRLGDYAPPFGSGYRALLDYGALAASDDPAPSTLTYWNLDTPRDQRVVPDVIEIENDPLAHKIALIDDLVASSPDIDGLMLDFMRIPHNFGLGTLSYETRVKLMVELLTAARAALDERAAQDGTGFLPLSVHIPENAEAHDELGIDLDRWAVAGVDMFVFGFERDWSQPFFYGKGGEGKNRIVDFAAAREQAGAVAVYQHISYGTEMRQVLKSDPESPQLPASQVCQHEIAPLSHELKTAEVNGVTYKMISVDTPGPRKKEDLEKLNDCTATTICEFPVETCELQRAGTWKDHWRCVNNTYAAHRRTTAEEIHSGAYAAYERGADGVFFFNMPYYRSGDGADPEVQSRPPFEQMACAGSHSCVEGQMTKPHYFLASQDELDYQELQLGYPMPVLLDGAKHTVLLNAPRPPSGWPAQMRLQLDLNRDWDGMTLEVLVNNVPVTFLSSVTSLPYASSPAQLDWITCSDTACEYRCPTGASCAQRCATGDPDLKRTFAVPGSVLRDGPNEISIQRTGGFNVHLERVDLFKAP
jgi:hypothetical protein